MYIVQPSMHCTSDGVLIYRGTGIQANGAVFSFIGVAIILVNAFVVGRVSRALSVRKVRGSKSLTTDLQHACNSRQANIYRGKQVLNSC